MNSFNFEINLTKCVLEKPFLNYLGSTIAGDGYCATDEKVKAICDYSLARRLWQLMRFCEMITFYHKSIPKSSFLLNLLYDILRDKKRKPKSTFIFL